MLAWFSYFFDLVCIFTASASVQVVIDSNIMLQETVYSLVKFPREFRPGFTPDYIRPASITHKLQASESIQVIDIHFLKKLATMSTEVGSDKAVSTQVFPV